MSFSDRSWTPTEDGSLAFLYAVLGSAAFATIATAAIVLLEPAPFLPADFLLFVFLIALVVIGVAAVGIGLPLTVLLAQRDWERAWTYPLAGFATGALLVLLAPLLLDIPRAGGLLAWLPFTPVGALSGLVCGAIWWLAFRRHESGGA